MKVRTSATHKEVSKRLRPDNICFMTPNSCSTSVLNDNPRANKYHQTVQPVGPC
jgi:hypothetical protein